MKQFTDHEFRRLVVRKFVPKRLINWGNDLAIVKNLMKKYPEREFWKKLVIRVPITSMKFFLGEKGKEIIETQYKTYKANSVVSKENKVEFRDKKVGVDKIVEKKHSSIKEKLKLW